MGHVEKHGECKWKLIAKQLPGRKGADCRKRWVKSDLAMVEGEEIKDDGKDSDKDFGPIKMGEWTSEEDKQVLEHGKSVGDKEWRSLAQKLPGRIQTQCRRRFKRLTNVKGNYVKVDGNKEKEENMTAWTSEEDQAIKDHVQKHGECKWKLIAK